MSATNFNTSNNTYRKLIGNGLTYTIPPFQRDYSWEEEQWDDLWQDILEISETDHDSAHYMGYLVLESSNDKEFSVIDGQQRLTTLSLICLAALKNLRRLIENDDDAQKNQQRYDQFRQTYIGYLDPITLVSKTKLTLNRNNDNYFQTFIVPLRTLPVRGLRASEGNLRKAFEWFDKKIQEYLKKRTDNKGVALAQLLENMSDRLFFTVISVTDELNAYKVFETLNARGVKLSSTDLLKNYLFSVLHRENKDIQELKILEDRWESLVSRLGSESFPDFLRAHWVSRRKSVRHTELYKTVRSNISNRQQVFELLRDLEEDVDIFLSITEPETSQWIPVLKKYTSLLRLFGVRQLIPLLVASYRKLPPDQFESVLRGCVVISFRYNVIGNFHTNEQERVYQQVAQRVSSNELTNASEVLVALRSIYPNDETFKASFTEKTLNTANTRNSKITKYIYAELEKQETNIEHDVSSDKYSIEHILPQNPQNGWESFNDLEAEVLVYRLGNMCLLESNINRELQNLPFTQKKPQYNKSAFQLTQEIAQNNNEWTPERIEQRQRSLANKATSIWRIAQLS